ncbi:cylicin-2-like [Cydia fagiglandana]|uniref:cylicin-2-like n=1 Tax=Cydia fagiglandana TaxID=1458189 RepID=UPI002FEE494A
MLLADYLSSKSLDTFSSVPRSVIKSSCWQTAQTGLQLTEEQAATEKKEKGTSQQFKQKSQGTGSASVSDGNDSSSTSSKRRTIKIESGVSFSIEFIDKGKTGSSKSTVSSVSSSEPEKDKKKKALHRCLCTTSFPTDDKKLKNKPCDSGVCVPGKCTPSECFKRLQEKYGSKKKPSKTDVSSSEASQTRKKKEKEGTILKEKGSSSISKYKESVEEKPLPPPEKFDIVKTIKNCCKKLQFWKKDKHIELKPGVIGTDISVKDDTKKFGSNASIQSGKSKLPKKDKKTAEKDDKGQPITADVKTSTGKKGIKEKKEKEETKGKKEQKGKKETKETTETKDKKEKKEKKGKKEQKGKKETTETKDKKDKKGKKETKEKGKKDTKDEIKTETKATGKKTRPLKPYECEPGVCTPKVCSPKECYERKYPPPPPAKLSNFMLFKNCVLKVCCKRAPAEEKTTTPSDAATQSQKLTPEKIPGTTIYQEKGTSGRKAGKKQKGETPAAEMGAPGPKPGKKQKGETPVAEMGAPSPKPGKKQKGETGKSKKEAYD